MPYFEEFVQTSLDGNPALRQLLLEILGTLLSNYRPKTIFVFCGASNSGKSVLADFLRWILGVPAITQIAHLRDFSLRWTIGNLKGKKLLVCTECEDESIGTDACAVIKTITGEPVLTGEQKHKDATTFRNTVRLLLVSNHLVRLDRVDAGFANRLVSSLANPAAHAAGERLGRQPLCVYYIGRANHAAGHSDQLVSQLHSTH